MPVNMKNIIADTFAKMVEKENVDKITVKALISECHISRQTFYYHFQDIMDVLEWSIRQATQHLVEKSLEAGDDMRSALKIFIAFSVDNYPRIRKLMESQRRKQIEQIMIEAAEAYLSELAQKRRPDLAFNYADREVILRFNAFGLVGILLMYCREKQLDQEKLAGQLELLLSGQLTFFERRAGIS